MKSAVTFTPLAGLGDNYVQISMLMNWAAEINDEIVVVYRSDGHVPTIEQRANSAIHVQVELLRLLAPHPNVEFACFSGHHPYPYNPEVEHAYSPSIMFDKHYVPRYWPLDQRKFSVCEIPDAPYVAVAFDVVSYPEVKAFTRVEISIILETIIDLGYSVIDVGGQRALSEKAFIIDRAAAFVGCASGLAHVAAGLHRPCYVLLPEADPPDFEWYAAILRQNGAHYLDRLRYEGGLSMKLDLPRIDRISCDIIGDTSGAAPSSCSTP